MLYFKIPSYNYFLYKTFKQPEYYFDPTGVVTLNAGIALQPDDEESLLKI